MKEERLLISCIYAFMTCLFNQVIKGTKVMRCLQPAKADKAGCCNPESERCSSQPGNSLKFTIVKASWLSKLSKLVVQVGFSN